VNAWLTEHPLPIAGTAGLFFVLTLVFTVLWLASSRNRKRQKVARINAEHGHREIELALQAELARLRIVREINEVAVHTVSVIISQADGAQYAARIDSEAAVRAAITIAELARAVLADLRRVVTVAQDGVAAATPQPRLETVRDLFRTMRDAGLDVLYAQSGDRFDIAGGC